MQRWANENEALVLKNVQLAHPLTGNIDSRVANLFIGTIFISYSNHYSLELSVKDIWVTIAKGVSIHLNQNAKNVRQFFVTHKKQKDAVAQSR